MCDESPWAYGLELDDWRSDEETRFLARQIAVRSIPIKRTGQTS